MSLAPVETILQISYNGSTGRALDFDFAFAQKLWCRDSNSTEFKKIHPHRSRIKSDISQFNTLLFLINPVSPIKWLHSAHYSSPCTSRLCSTNLSSLVLSSEFDQLLSSFSAQNMWHWDAKKCFLLTTLFELRCAATVSKLCLVMFSEAAYQVLFLCYILCVYVEAHREARKPHEKSKVNFLEL